MNPIFMMMVTFIGLAIIFFIAGNILGNDSLSDCTSAKGYNASGTTNELKYPDKTWAGACYQQTQNVISAFAILGVIFVVLAAVMVIHTLGWLG